MKRIRRYWKNKAEGISCHVTRRNEIYILYVRTRSTGKLIVKEYKTAAGVIKYLESNGFNPHPAPSEPKEIYLQKVRAKSLDLGSRWLLSIIDLINANTVSQELGITKNQFHSWLEDPIFKIDIDYTKYRKLRKKITGY